MNLSIIDLIKDINGQSKKYLKTQNYIGWKCTYVPEEIIMAAGFIPYRIMGANIGINKAKSYLQGNLNPYTQSCLECALKGDYDFLKGVIIGNSDDASRRLFDVWQKYLKNAFVYLLDIPKSTGEDAIERYKLEIENLIRQLEKKFEIKITDASLRKSARIINETRNILNSLNEVRKKDSSFVKSSEFLEIMKLAMTQPKELFNKSFSLALKEAVSKEKNINAKSGPRILLTGSFQDQGWLTDIIEELGGSVVCEDICTRVRYFADNVDEESDDILSAISKRYIQKPPCARMVDLDKRLKHIYNLLKEFNINGVIYYLLKFDDPYLFEFPEVKQSLRNNEIPVLLIESDHCLGAKEQIKTRIQAFLETLSIKIGTLT